MGIKQHKCATCGKLEALAYKTWWYRVNKGTGKCNSCSKKGGNQTSFKTGQETWNKGMRGYGRWAKWHPQGELNPAWKGGITAVGKRIRNSKEYAAWRKSVFERDGYTCQLCHEKGGKLCADHIKPFSLFPALRMDLNNGRTLCFDCHKQTDTYLSRLHSYVI